MLKHVFVCVCVLKARSWPVSFQVCVFLAWGEMQQMVPVYVESQCEGVFGFNVSLPTDFG